MGASGAQPFGAAQSIDDIPRSGNPFFEDWALEAALRHLPRAGRSVEIAGAPSRATGIPLVRRLNLAPMLGSIWGIWSHIHCFDTTPDGRIDAETLLDEVLAFVRRRNGKLLYWQDLPVDTPFLSELIQYLSARGLHFEATRTRMRPLFDARDKSGPDAKAARLEGKRMAELRRCRRRLHETGRVSTAIYRGRHDPNLWMDAFLRLEASGWKGRTGTAIACNDAERAFFNSLMRHAADRGQVLVCSLEVDSQPMAMTLNLRAGQGLWGFKTAYCNSVSRYSPGALVACETALAALTDPTIAWIDSCMDHDGGPLGKLWHHRRTTVDLMISTSRTSNVLPRLARPSLAVLRGVKAMMKPLRETPFGSVPARADGRQ